MYWEIYHKIIANKKRMNALKNIQGRNERRAKIKNYAVSECKNFKTVISYNDMVKLTVLVESKL